MNAKGADAAWGMSDIIFHLFKWDHFGFDMKRILIFTVVDPGSSLCENQNRFVTNEKGHGFGNHARFYAQSLGSFHNSCGGCLRFNNMIGKADRFKISFCFCE